MTETIEVKKSSNIKQVDYDPNKLRLVVHFKNGTKYEYLGVNTAMFERLATADSMGSFFHKNIRNRYDSKKL